MQVIDKNIVKSDNISLLFWLMTNITFPLNPLEVTDSFDLEARRLRIEGVLDSYHGNYDALSEAVQNAVDALEDAKLAELAAPYLVEVTVNLDANWIGVLDTGIGMSPEQIASAFAPQATFKKQSKRDRKNQYRGHKGVGLTFLSYGTDDILLHSKQEGGDLIKTRMQYGRAWAVGGRQDAALLNDDPNLSPLNSYKRGTYVQIQFSPNTHPKLLRKLANTLQTWNVILRTKTAIGQIQLGRAPVVPITAKLKLIQNAVSEEIKVEPEFLYPHKITRNPAFRFLDLVDYHANHPEQVGVPDNKARQDGLYLVWDSARIEQELTAAQKKDHAEQIKNYTPFVYAFIPYQDSVWSELNKIETGVENRNYLYPGLTLAVNAQRLADLSVIKATRYELFGIKAFVIVHFDGIRPDQGRKTISLEAEDFAYDAADRVVQYLGSQKAFLRPAGEIATAGERENEKNHADWTFNVKLHHTQAPLHIDKIKYLSTPLTEQDVVGLFNQCCALNLFPGLQIYATSQIKTYDCLIRFDTEHDAPGFEYGGAEQNPLGITPFVHNSRRFSTRELTLEFKNNLEALTTEFEGNSPKSFNHIDICVCWWKTGDTFRGYELEEITDSNADKRKYPGVTHLLRRDGDTHVVSIIMLKTVTDMILSGRIIL